MVDQPLPPFDIRGPETPCFPVILSVPHAGRDYPPELLQASRLGLDRLQLLEDRHAERLIETATTSGFTAIVARRPRAWIDLNRHEREIDPDMIEPDMRREALIRSSKVTGGLGLLPRRLRDNGEILNRRVARADLDRRLAEDYRPYHARLADLLRHARDRFGIAVLLDIHSMPPLGDDAAPGAQIVFGDRFGQSAAARHTAVLRELVHRAGYRSAENIPYAGGHILAAHARPRSNIHAVQVEIDRSLYLKPGLKDVGQGLEKMSALVDAMAQALSDEALGSSAAIAAE